MTELSTGRQAIIEASPEPITIDTARTAVIVVDMQNDFGSKGGMFDRAGVDIAPIQKVVEPISRVLESARRAGIKIIYLKMGFRPDLSDAGPADSPNRLKPSRLGYGDAMRAPDGTDGRIEVLLKMRLERGAHIRAVEKQLSASIAVGERHRLRRQIRQTIDPLVLGQ